MYRLTEVGPGLRVVRNITPTAPFNEPPEISLVIDTPEGQVLVVGCSHPGVERIVASVARTSPHIAMIAGGLHWVATNPPGVERVAVALHDGTVVELTAKLTATTIGPRDPR